MYSIDNSIKTIMTTDRSEYRINLQARHIREKKYYCIKCDMAYRDKYQLDRHKDGKKHNNNYTWYYCTYDGCSYKNNTRFHRDKHLLSRKHSG